MSEKSRNKPHHRKLFLDGFHLNGNTSSTDSKVKTYSCQFEPVHDLNVEWSLQGILWHGNNTLKWKAEYVLAKTNHRVHLLVSNSNLSLRLLIKSPSERRQMICFIYFGKYKRCETFCTSWEHSYSIRIVIWLQLNYNAHRDNYFYKNNIYRFT